MTLSPIEQERSAAEPERGAAAARAASSRAAGHMTAEPERMPTTELLREIAGKVTELAHKEVQLARAELWSDLRSQIAMVKGLAFSALAALCALQLLLLALVFGLARSVPVPDWAVALYVCAALLAVSGLAGAIAWHGRVRKPMERTRRSLEEDVDLTKETLA